MLKITARSDRIGSILELEGKLAGSWVQELETCWQRTIGADQRVKIMLKAVTFIDAAGRDLLARMHAGGAELAGEGCMTKAIIEKIYQEHDHE
jgi:anti-anti-sigma regulatory factor